MNPAETNTPRQLEEVLQAAEDSLMDRDQWQTFTARLANEPELRRSYLEHMHVSAAVREEAHAAFDPERAHIHPFQRSTKIHPFTVSLLAAAATITIAALVLARFIAPAPLPAEVSASPHADWHFKRGGIAADGTFIPGSQINLAEGNLQLTFPSGTKAILESPGTFEIREQNLLHFAHGSVWCDVSPRDTGFTVLTDNLRVIDLGTRFGVRATPQGEQVHVASGTVEVKPRLPGRAPRTIRSGQAVSTTSAGGLSDVPFREKLFLTDLTTTRRLLHWDFRPPSYLLGSDATDRPTRLHTFLNSKPAPVPNRRHAAGNALDLTAPTACAHGPLPRLTTGTGTVFCRLSISPFQLDASENDSPLPPRLLGWENRNFADPSFFLAITPDGRTLTTFWGTSGHRSALPAGDSLIASGWRELTIILTGATRPDGQPEVLHYLDGKLLPAVPTTVPRYPAELSGFFLGRPESFRKPELSIPMLVDEISISDSIQHPNELVAR